MTVLVAAAGRHGSTMEIAHVIGRVLEQCGSTVDVRAAHKVTMVDAYEAVVLGSAVYLGHWLRAARDLADSEALALTHRPVWLFSSGRAASDEEPDDIATIIKETKAREHRMFAGRLDKRRLSLAEKAILLTADAPVGDFRDWAAIRAWAARIATTLQEERTAGSAVHR